MSRSLSRWQALLLGLAVLAGTALGGVGLFVVGSRVWPGRHDLHVRVGFPEIRGVEVGTRVRLQGIDAGEVAEILPPDSPNGLVLLRLRVKGDYRHLVRVSSTVQIVAEGMLGGKVVEIRPPAVRPGQPAPQMDMAANDTLLAGEPSQELADVVAQLGEALKGVQQGQGTLGMLVKDPRAYEAVLALLQGSNEAVQKSKDTMTAIQRDADALKRVPILGGYVEDPVALLVRPTLVRHRQVFDEADLFEPGRAVLTADGKEKLNGLAGWVEEHKVKGSEVVVVAYADPRKGEPKAALEVTRQQSDAVLTHLKSNQKVQKTGWFSSRKATALGMGVEPPPVKETETLPAARVEVVVFVPQS